MAKQPRSIRKPGFAFTGDQGALEAMILKIRLAQVMRGRVGARRATKIGGVGEVVVSKERPSKTIATINGKRVKTIDLVRAINCESLQKEFGARGREKKSSKARTS